MGQSEVLNGPLWVGWGPRVRGCLLFLTSCSFFYGGILPLFGFCSSFVVSNFLRCELFRFIFLNGVINHGIARAKSMLVE